MSIWQLLRQLKRSPRLPFRNLVNLAYWDPDTVVIHPRNFDYVVVDGCKFYVTDQIDSIQRVKGNPWFSGIKEGDICLDIGANIGAISIPLAISGADSVYSVEPLFYEELEDNISLNHLEDRVIPLPIAIGRGEKVTIEFSSRKRRGVECLTFESLQSIVLEQKGRLDFLKIDCEGAEWDIDPHTLDSRIREIRVEFHIRRFNRSEDKMVFYNWISILQLRGYETNWEEGRQPGPMVEFSNCYLLSASRKSK